MFVMVLNMLLEALGNDGYCVLCQFKCKDTLQVFKFVVDSGSAYTCLNASYLGSEITEDYCKSQKFETQVAYGILKETDDLSVLLYKIPVEEFLLGKDTKLSKQFVYITFDKRFSSFLLGRDVLNQLYYYHAKESKKLCISNSHDEIIQMANEYK